MAVKAQAIYQELDQKLDIVPMMGVQIAAIDPHGEWIISKAVCRIFLEIEIPLFIPLVLRNGIQSAFIFRLICMTTVKKIIDQKTNVIFSVSSSDPVESVLKIMRDFRVRAVLVIDDGQLKGIVSQGDCAIKVLLPHHNPTKVAVSEIMTHAPLTVSLSNSLDECMAIMVHKHIRHLPVVENHKVIGVISVGDLVKNIIEHQGHQIKFLETYIKGHGV